jgi:predicted DCC family thiol-disulfide oxidoreductase YuxK
MKTLSNHILIYDDECPLCRAYTSTFVSSGMLDAGGRKSFSEVVKSELPMIDWNRARNEIALVNRNDNTVTYGVESIVQILGNNLPCIKSLFRLMPINYILRKLYAFISYNRKVVAPGKAFEVNCACTPDLHYGYRWAYIMITWLITSIVLLFYSRLAIPFIPETTFFREFIVCGGQVVFQGIVMLFVKRERAIHYLGNMMTVSLLGALALCPAFLLSPWISSPIFYVGYFMTVVGLMFLEHKRRVKILGLPWYLSVTWVLYRLIVLAIIL